ncbi:DUF805 domain-containing protein [Tropicimonas sp. S265A]|uniref:DUF805 domain-containing protein n=1 Tax=Tropicimonas sp. S265A TaxID=3415134 RepID=UPI003C798211
MSFPSAVATAYAKVFSFRGRATVGDFWSFFLFQALVGGGVAYWLFNMSGMAQVLPMVGGNTDVLLGAAVLFALPGYSLMIRRLHDSGRSGLWMMIAAVPVFGALALLVLLIQPSEPTVNRFDIDTPAQKVDPRPATRATAQMTPIPVESRSSSADVRALYASRIAGLSKNPVYGA